MIARCLYSGVARGQQSAEGGKTGGDKGSSGISRLLGAAKSQSAPGAENSRYAAVYRPIGGRVGLTRVRSEKCFYQKHVEVA